MSEFLQLIMMKKFTQTKFQLKEFLFHIFPDFLREKALAYHEAGHAIACYRLKLPISKVTIIMQDNCLGYVDHPENWRVNIGKRLDGENNAEWKIRIQKLIQNLIIEKLCGGIAEKKYRGYPNRNGMKSDLELIDHALTDLTSTQFFNQIDKSDAKTYIDNCSIVASQLIENPDNWRAIEAIVGALLKSKELSEQDVLEIIDDTFN